MNKLLTLCETPFSLNGVRFLTGQPLLYYPTMDYDEMVLAKAFEVEFMFKDSLIYIKVDRGFKFDGASIPQWGWSIIGSPFNGKYRLATFIHDSLYKSNSTDRYYADSIMKYLMHTMDVPNWKQVAMYRAVRFGGSSAWKNADVDNNKKLVTITIKEL